MAPEDQGLQLRTPAYMCRGHQAVPITPQILGNPRVKPLSHTPGFSELLCKPHYTLPTVHHFEGHLWFRDTSLTGIPVRKWPGAGRTAILNLYYGLVLSGMIRGECSYAGMPMHACEGPRANCKSVPSLHCLDAWNGILVSGLEASTYAHRAVCLARYIVFKLLTAYYFSDLFLKFKLDSFCFFTIRC